MTKKLFFLTIILATTISCSGNNQDSIVYQNTPTHATVLSPEIPTSINFAGTTTDLTRYDLRERLDREIISICYMHTVTLLTFKRANRFISEVESILAEENIPDDFKYLMLIESNGDQLARSHVGAAGVWQFMESTGREYDLEVNKEVDERYNIELATHAACKYLRDAYKKYGNWYSVAASYNAGQGKISKELREQQVDTALDLYLISETSRYSFRIMAMKIVLADPSKYGFVIDSSQLYPPLQYKTVTVDYPVADWASWAKEQGITYAQLRDLNPWIRSNTLSNKSGKQYKIKIIDKKSLNYNPNKTKNHLPFGK